MRLAFRGVAQEAHVTGLIDHEEVLDRVALLLATVILVLLLGISRAMDRSLRTILPTRGRWAPPSSGWSRGEWLPRRPGGREASRGVLAPDSLRYGGDESTYGHSLGISQRVDLALPGWDSVSERSE
jgi:hypothetical protein